MEITTVRYITLILFLIVLSIAVIYLYPILIFQQNLRTKAYEDYQSARGTKHLEEISNCLVGLKREYNKHNRFKNNLEKELDSCTRERETKLKIALTTRIVERELDNIKGIGKTLKQKIINNCFNGTLQSLNRAHYVVYGVGEERAWEISQWIRQKESEMPQLLKGEFPQKWDIIQNYEKIETNLIKELNKVMNKYTPLATQRSIVIAHQKQLKQVSVRTFLFALKGDKNAITSVNKYLNGAFPEWGSVPKWYTQLTTKYGH